MEFKNALSFESKIIFNGRMTPEQLLPRRTNLEREGRSSPSGSMNLRKADLSLEIRSEEDKEADSGTL